MFTPLRRISNLTNIYYSDGCLTNQIELHQFQDSQNCFLNDPELLHPEMWRQNQRELLPKKQHEMRTCWPLNWVAWLWHCLLVWRSSLVLPNCGVFPWNNNVKGEAKAGLFGASCNEGDDTTLVGMYVCISRSSPLCKFRLSNKHFMERACVFLVRLICYCSCSCGCSHYSCSCTSSIVQTG